MPCASPKLLNLNLDHSSKKMVFLVKSLHNWGCDNFFHRRARVNKFWSHLQYNMIHWIKFCWWYHTQKLRRHKRFHNTFILRGPRVAIFAYIIKIVTMYIYWKGLSCFIKTGSQTKNTKQKAFMDFLSP